MENAELNEWGLEFHHLGLAVAEPSDARVFLAGLGYFIGDVVHDTLQNVNLLMCFHRDMPAVEIVYPAEGDGPLDKLLRTHKDGLIYHMCFVTRDLNASLESLETQANLSVHCVSEPKPAVLFGGRRVSFYVIGGLGLIEVIEGQPEDDTPDKREIIGSQISS